MNKHSGCPNLLAMWDPALRWHEFEAGRYVERENLHPQCKGKRTSCYTMSSKVPKCGKEADSLVVAMKMSKDIGAKGRDCFR